MSFSANHPHLRQLALLAGGELPWWQRYRWAFHTRNCESCRQELEAFEHTRAFVAENVYEVVRHYRLLAYCAGREPSTQDEWSTLIGIRLMFEEETLPPWDIFEYALKHHNDILWRQTEASKVFKIKESIPDWLDDLGREELGENWEPTMSALNQPACVTPLVIPRSLNEPVGFSPSCLRYNVSTPAHAANFGVRYRFVLPSGRLTTISFGTFG